MTNQQGALVAAPQSAYSQQDKAFHAFWYRHMLDDLMQPPLAGTSYATARYIWDAAQVEALSAAQAELAAMRAGGEPVAWAATSEDGDVEALGMNQSRRFDTPLYTHPQPAAQEGEFLILPPRPKAEAPANTVGLDWDAYSGMQMLYYGRLCADAAIAAQQGDSHE